MHRISLVAALLCIATAFSPIASADGPFATLPYHNLYDYQKKIAALQGLDRLSIGLSVTSTRPDVPPGDIKLVIHRASGALQDIPVDSTGHISLPVSDELQKEDPQVVSNQPEKTLDATLSLELRPLTALSMNYADLLAGVQQLDTAIDREPMVAAMFKSKPTGLLLFFNYGKHTLTIHDTAKGHVVKSEAARPGKGHLKGLHIGQLLETTTLIYVKLDPKLLKSNPKITLDGTPDETLPAI
jgi:hypothetical protein